LPGYQLFCRQSSSANIMPISIWGFGVKGTGSIIGNFRYELCLQVFVFDYGKKVFRK
jgi:hypothetical protein